MPQRLRAQEDPPSEESVLPGGRSITVKRTAVELDTDHATVRRLVRARELTGHYVGLGRSRRSLRIYVASIEAYRARNAIAAPAPIEDKAVARSRPRYNRDHQRALVALTAAGVHIKTSR
jgi:hypothetical protein